MTTITLETQEKVMRDLWQRHLQWQDDKDGSYSPYTKKEAWRNEDGTYRCTPDFYASLKSYIAYHSAFEITNGVIYATRFGRKQSNVIGRKWEQIDAMIAFISNFCICDGEEKNVFVLERPHDNSYNKRAV
tara:strand:- start:24423 stop:24815 length:393 start_codon:yes stop_codon:yes gene_type:complete